jgi:drug/metabolite transporter (DMT)-like permease
METSYKTKNSKEIRSNFLLLITAVIWGGGIVAQRLGMQELGPYIFNGFRFLVGALTLVPVIIIRKKRIPKHESELK